MIRAVVFDLDDTLYPEIEFVYSGYQAVAEAVRGRLGIEIYDDLTSLFGAGQRGDLFTPVLRKHLGDVQEPYVEQLVSIYRKHEPILHPYPEVPDLLRKLKPSHRLAIISDGRLCVQQRKLQALHLDGYFDVVIFTDQWGREAWKPSTRSYEAVLERLSVSGMESVYIADNPSKDFHGARRVGMHTIRVRRPGNIYGQLEPPSSEFAPDLEIETLNGLDTALADLSG